MNLFDILLLCIILICFATGLRSGLIRQVFSLAAIIGGIALGFFFHESLGNLLLEKNIIAEPEISNILGFLIAACSAYILIHYLSRFLTDVMEKINMGWIDHLLGGAMGFIIGLLLCYLVVVGVKQFVGEDSPFVKNSVLAPKVVTGYHILREQAPDNLDKSLEKFRELREGKEEPDFE
ncbi:MAG: CvpA family protein [Candidatus Dadabacteria bacterium]|nr:CvpA family protein [Candidatus Dadabacteria bacterium]MYC39575.1 CvpA family protein [Candidatus Dadabacteria bacterium]